MLSILPAPQSVLHQLGSIQRDFLWGKRKEHKKWALVAWDKISKPKSFVGLVLDDPDLLSKVLGAKLWWRWVKEPETQWAIIWKEKYASSWHNHDLIRMSCHRKGSHIWNKAWDKRSLVKGNSFWEFREGNLSLFWEIAVLEGQMTSKLKTSTWVGR